MLKNSLVFFTVTSQCNRCHLQFSVILTENVLLHTFRFILPLFPEPKIFFYYFKEKLIVWIVHWKHIHVPLFYFFFILDKMLRKCSDARMFERLNAVPVSLKTDVYACIMFLTTIITYYEWSCLKKAE